MVVEDGMDDLRVDVGVGLRQGMTKDLVDQSGCGLGALKQLVTNTAGNALGVACAKAMGNESIELSAPEAGEVAP
jgi:hypothetical protein